MSPESQTPHPTLSREGGGHETNRVIWVKNHIYEVCIIVYMHNDCADPDLGPWTCEVHARLVWPDPTQEGTKLLVSHGLSF